MNLTSRLRQFHPQQTKKIEIEQAIDLDPILHGEQVPTPYGNCYVVQKSLPLHELHGRWPLSACLEVNSQTLARLGYNAKNDFNIHSCLFLDTETTGLAGGTGTYAFLVGIGRFQDNNFVVKQFFMRDYHEEPALLYLLSREFLEIDTIISFNGKTFDLPLLQTRFTMSRLDLPKIEKYNQLDLLHLARRLWRRKFASCSLNNLEAQLLGIRRLNDIPGFEIPGRYFQFLHTKQGELLEDIIIHNQIDIFSMATLLYKLHATAKLTPGECGCPWEAEALARLMLAQGEQELAIRYFTTAKTRCHQDEQRIRVLHELALIYKRRNEYTKAKELWQLVLKLQNHDLTAHEELAKFYEHKAKDFPKADRITRRALAIAWQLRSPKVHEFEHRLQRLERKARQ